MTRKLIALSLIAALAAVDAYAQTTQKRSGRGAAVSARRQATTVAPVIPIAEPEVVAFAPPTEDECVNMVVRCLNDKMEIALSGIPELHDDVIEMQLELNKSGVPFKCIYTDAASLFTRYNFGSGNASPGARITSNSIAHFDWLADTAQKLANRTIAITRIPDPILQMAGLPKPIADHDPMAPGIITSTVATFDGPRTFSDDFRACMDPAQNRRISMCDNEDFDLSRARSEWSRAGNISPAQSCADYRTFLELRLAKSKQRATMAVQTARPRLQQHIYEFNKNEEARQKLGL
ncbi:MAG: hypothetical protein FWD15_05760 [Alphaproteobacteria bacterium]|nr:hypothetical protein [Alphaproteobacteria bacterium]